MLFAMVAGAMLSFQGSRTLFALERSVAYEEKLRQNQLERPTALRNIVHLGLVLLWLTLMLLDSIMISTLLLTVVTFYAVRACGALFGLISAAVLLLFLCSYFWFQLQLGMASSTIFEDPFAF